MFHTDTLYLVLPLECNHRKLANPNYQVIFGNRYAFIWTRFYKVFSRYISRRVRFKNAGTKGKRK